MSITAHGSPWDQDTFKRIERKGGCHYRSPVSDYIDLERKIEAHELRYADRVEVYGDGTYNGMRITDSVVVLNGGLYMSTGIKAEATEQERYDSISVTGSGRQVEDDEDPTDINPNRLSTEPHKITLDHVGHDRNRLHSPTVDDLDESDPPEQAMFDPFASWRERDDSPALSEADEELRVSLGMTREQWDEWNHGGGWSNPTPIDPRDLSRSAIYFAAEADRHRRAARWWAAATVACLLLTVAILFIPTEWIYLLFEAFRS